MSIRDDWSRSTQALYACPCGSLVAGQRWLWIDCEARPELAATVRAEGPFVGACSRCRRPAGGSGAWLEIEPARGAATLVLSADRRGDLIAALQAHLADLPAHAEQTASWLLQPAIAFAPVPTPWADAGDVVQLSPWPSEAQETAPPAGDLAPEPTPRPDEPALLHPPRPSAVLPGPGEAPQAAVVIAGEAPREPAARAVVAVSENRTEEPGLLEHVFASMSEEISRATRTEPDERREGGAAAAPVTDPVRRVEGGAAEARGPGRPRPRATAGHEPPLQDTFPGRRPARGAEEQDPAEASAGRRSEATGSSGQEPAAIAPAAGRRAIVEGTGTSGQELGNMSPGAGRRSRGSEGTGSSGQDPAGMSAGPGRRAAAEEAGAGEPGPEGERQQLRAAVARALTPAGTPAATPGAGPRPAAVLPGPGTAAEGPASDSGTTWPKRQAGESAADSGTTWPKRQAGESAADSGTTWPKRPTGEFAALDGGAKRAAAEPGDGAGKRAGEEAEAGTRHRPPAPPRAPAPPTPPPLRLGPDVQRAGLGTLGQEGGAVQVSAVVNEATARVWAMAPVKVRPIHLRGLGYPLVGVRCVAEVGGEPLILDAVVDVGHSGALEIFKQLAREFKIRLAVRTADGAHPVSRDLVAPELQRNAGACLESAQAQLGTGDFSPDAYRSANERLAASTAGQRLEPARTPLAEGLVEGCRASAAAAYAALERVDLASKKDNLARLLEVDGLSVVTYEKIRSAVLAAAIEFGLPAPARFWRRWLGSEQARDVGAFVQRLIAARTASIARGEDLPAEQVEAAWRGILDLCQHKNLTPPPDVSRALGLGKVTNKRASQPQIKVASEAPAPAPAAETARSSARRRELAARLKRSPSDGDIRAVIGSLPELSEMDVASLLPAIAELGGRVVPELLSALRAPQRHVRQAAAVLLGHLADRKAEGPMVAMLGDEPTGGWVDAARALGNLGPRVVGPLCVLLRSAPTGRKEVVGTRVARALVELMKVEGGGPGGSGRQAVENLLDVGDPSVSAAARRALATLGAVRDEVDGDDAEASRRFSRLASDAIAPELDAAADDEIDEVEVEVGD